MYGGSDAVVEKSDDVVILLVRGYVYHMFTENYYTSMPLLS